MLNSVDTAEVNHNSYASRIKATVVYSGGVITSYVAAPVVTYLANPVINYVATPAISIVGTAIATAPVSTPVFLAMTASVIYATPRLLAYPLKYLYAGTAIAGEVATTTALDGTKQGLTYLYNAITAVPGSVWTYFHKPAEQSDPEQLEIDEHRYILIS